MNLPYFISKRIHTAGKESFSAVIHKIAIASVALGIAIMVLSFMILGGFQNNIKDKIYSFSGHLQVKKFSFSNSMEEDPVGIAPLLLDSLRQESYISHIQGYAHKPGIVSIKDEVFGLVFKGIGEDFNWQQFVPYLVKGDTLSFDSDLRFHNDILISEKKAQQMQVELGDRFVIYFPMDPPRTRTVTIKGIFKTGLEDFDEQMVLGDIDLIRFLNAWENGEVGGYEVFVKNINNLEASEDALIDRLSIDTYTERMDEKFSNIFDWLNLLSQNVYILIALILFVACFNMVSVLFILIMERTTMIGALKALGAQNQLIRKIFAWNGSRLVLKGMLVGNGLSLLLGFLQYQFAIIPLDAATYYMSYVPIQWDWLSIIGINVLTLLLVGLTLVIPTTIISRISPVKAIRFD